MSTLILKSRALLAGLRQRRSQAVLAGFFAVIIAVILLFDVHGANAQIAGVGNQPFFSFDFWFDLISRIFLAISGLFLKLTLFILTFVIELAGYNGYLDSPAVTTGWVMVRDITNMGFVVILLLIAFGTILGIEQYEWKKLLVKFVFAAILVNFSRTICGIFIDLGQVLMSTFVNGIAATAGGNLISAFNLSNILNLSNNTNPADIGSSGFLIASIASLFFTAMVMCVMGAFLYLLLVRMVVLWVLIVLSPFAFVLSVLPQTESYANEWWSELTANIITGPVLLFFIWLSFVTLGSGNIHQDIANNSSVSNKISDTIDANNVGNTQFGAASQSAGITQAMTWTQMANFAIAISMLLVGYKAAQKLGGAGAEMIGTGLEYGKSLATSIAKSPLRVGKFTGKALGKAAWYLGKGDQKVDFFKRQAAGFQQWIHDDGYIPKMREQKNADGTVKKDAEGNVMYEFVKKQRFNEETQKWEDTKELEYEVDEKGNPVRRKRFLDPLQRILNRRAMEDLQSKKLLEKTEKDRDITMEIADKRVKAAPKHWFQTKEEQGIDALDRVRQGILEGEKQRSAAKTGEFQPLGTNLVLDNKRIQFDLDNPKGALKIGEKSVAEVIAAHEGAGAAAEAVGKRVKDQAAEHFALSEQGRQLEAQKLFDEKKSHHAHEEIENLKIALSRNFNDTETGKQMSRAEAEAKNLKEGFQAEEELRVMKAQLELFKENKAEFEKYLKAAGGDKDKAWQLMALNKNIMSDHNDHSKVGMSAFFAAKAIGERDHEYNFYQAKKRETVDSAAQDLIWKQRGIKTATTAAQEGIVEGLMKPIRNMSYDQLLKAMKKHSTSIDQRGGPDDRDKYYSEALMRHAYSKGWVDDSVLAAWETNLKSQGLNEDERQKHTLDVASRSGGGGGISRSNHHQVVDFLTKHKVDVNVLQNIREKKVGPDMDALREVMKKEIENNPMFKFMGIEKMEHLEKAIHDMRTDDFNDFKRSLEAKK